MAQRRQTAARQQQQPPPREEPPPKQKVDIGAATAAFFDDEADQIERVDIAALTAITKGEVEMQIDAAHKYPRNIKTFLENARALVTMDQVTAASCIYKLERWDSREQKNKILAGPSVRLAEMAATSYRNLHTAARVLDIRDRDVIVQAQTWDLEANNRVGIEVTRNIMTSPKQGAPKRFGDDMIRVTCMAAIAIARRNAVFTVIPRAFINNIYAAATEEATGAARGKHLEELRKLIGWFIHKQKIPVERICSYFQVAKWEEITEEQHVTLIAMANAIKDNEKTADEFFSPPGGAGPRPVAKSAALDELAKKKRSDPPPANDAAPTAPATDASAFTDAKVIEALVDADESWGNLSPAAARAIVEAWGAAEKHIAYDWAIAFVQTAEDQPPPEQPEFTFLSPADPESDGR